MKKHSFKVLFLFSILIVSCTSSKIINQVDETQFDNVVNFEVSPYGLIFTKLKVKDETVNAMIDFGDPNILQFSSKFVTKHSIPVKKIQAKMYDIRGNEYDINFGTIENVSVGKEALPKTPFSSSPGEMESVSKQINTEFNAVVGWGYFSKYFIQLDYNQRKFYLNKTQSPIAKFKAQTPLMEDVDYLIIPVSFKGHEVKAVIDTGSPVTVVDPSIAKYSSPGQSTFNIGSVKFEDKFYTEDLSILEDMGIKMIIGGTFLQKHIIHIDPFNHQLTIL